MPPDATPAPTATSRASRPLRSGMLLAGILLVAVNLRPVITAVGPVLPDIAADVGLSGPQLGLLAAVPIIAFAVVSPVVHPLIHRFGVERTVLAALLVLAVGTLVRSLPGPAADLWIGSALIGATIAVGNVALPVVVKEDFPNRLATVTALYVAAQSVFAAIASGVAVPVEQAGSWRTALGVWVVLVPLAVGVWLPRILAARARRAAVRPGPANPAPAGAHDRGPVPEGHKAADGGPRRSVYRSGLAWLVAAYMGLQSTVFYILLNWLPTVEQDLGIDPATAGWHLFTFQAVAIGSNLAVPLLMRVGRDERFAAVSVPAAVVVAMLGIWFAPGLMWVWAVLIGTGTGAAFVISLSFMGLRAADSATASRLSAMSQAVGYGLAAAGLVLAGVLRELTGPGPLLVLAVAAVALAQLLVGLRVGRPQVLRT